MSDGLDFLCADDSYSDDCDTDNNSVDIEDECADDNGGDECDTDNNSVDIEDEFADDNDGDECDTDNNSVDIDEDIDDGENYFIFGDECDLSSNDSQDIYDGDGYYECIKGLTKAKKKMEQKEDSTAKSGSRKRNRKSKESARPYKKRKVESKSKVSQKYIKKSRKNKEFLDRNKFSNKNRKKRSQVQISPSAIRTFSAKFVKISKDRMKWARKMANIHIEFIRKYCKTHASEIFSHFEFTGSFYEHLKTEDADELDILVALDTKNNADLMVEEVDGVPGYALIKVTKKSSKYWRFVDNKRYVDPTQIRSWFFGLVQKAVNQYDKDKQEKDPELKPSENGPATKLLIDDKEAKKKLEVDLVPAFLFKPKKDRLRAAPVKGIRYVAKPPEDIKVDELKRGMLWRQSFSLEEKKEMEKMDKEDQGCRHEIVKVIKTIVKNDGPPLNILSSYHIKTAFLHYNFDKDHQNLKWSRKHLPERFLGLMDYLKQKISERNLSHFFIKKLNLLEQFSFPTLHNIENRLSKLISNEKELKKVLKQLDNKTRRYKKRS
ncbi:cyclic GMP-AMP synthase-like [Actinia tenebrosa]|uniref:Cyclic GMP-AMP synthase-like n=1 Tax=Actinia tenebrosa TaxID=6105 RepID=A0A6P8HT74_ACTTE|nr:cyclic GMP-AMP synthase-like [Actinia tenebrosa]